jgi:hypothetical protein
MTGYEENFSHYKRGNFGVATSAVGIVFDTGGDFVYPTRAGLFGAGGNE